MSKNSKKPTHPGVYVRKHVIPADLSVKEAATILGVGRPALSNFLNGKSALSPEMAVRLEKSFGADRQKLLELQTRFDGADTRKDENEVAVRAYVPSFLSIKARQIDEWSGTHLAARAELPVFLRKLIHSTGQELLRVDFPGYDNAERKGWDGFVESGAATPWIPNGKSGWEVGCNQDPRAKADHDYSARTDSVPAEERAECTFVFVTPHNWPGKGAWIKDKEASGEWKSVRAFDASDLEQWLEQSIPAQIWLAERLAIPTTGFATIEQCWQRWAAASDPQMSREIFAPSIASYRSTFKNWLDRDADRPFAVAADSRDEALAFLACLFEDEMIAASYPKDLAVYFDSPETLRRLAATSSPFIPIVGSVDTECELATVHRRLHCIVVRPRNAVDSEPDIALDLLGHETFSKALAAMGIESDDADRLASESGRSPTILRRRLSNVDAIRTPHWAHDAVIARSLAPMMLVGAWHATSKADREIVSLLAHRDYSDVEDSLPTLLMFDDCPVWSAGQFRGVASKIDGLFAVSKLVTSQNLDDFFTAAEYVLSESDPALDLPEDRRWAAGIYGKVRDHSAALREGLCETLVILSVHGNSLFQERLGIDVEARVSDLIRRLLTPLTPETLLSHRHDLEHYAEAAPAAFLRLIEEDLAGSEPMVFGILKPVDSGIFGGDCPRSGLLWALECLAWKPQNLSRVTVVLARLSEPKIDDNWANKPDNTLRSIYRAWMPQTAAPLHERIKALEMLTRRHPEIGWEICIDQFDPHSSIGHYNYRPRWRSDASGAGQPVTNRERYEFVRKALDLAIAWPTHNEKTLGDLIERFQAMTDEDQTAVWGHVNRWAESEAGHAAKAALRERVRRFAFTRRSRRRNLKAATTDRAREAFAKLAPSDPVLRHGWLFTNQWVEESSDELEDHNLDFSKRDERIQRSRSAALKEIWSERGFEGLKALLSDSGAPHIIGQHMSELVSGDKASRDFLRQCLSVSDGELERKTDGCIQGLLHALDPETRNKIIASVAKGLDIVETTRLLKCAPFGQDTWRVVESRSEDVHTKYWREVYPYWNRHSPEELIELIDRLLEVDRPRAAFQAVHMDWNDVETSRLKRLLRAVATSNAEPAGAYRLSSHDISEALDSLNARTGAAGEEAASGRTGMAVEEMAQLEFLFIRALDHSEHGIPNLERQISQSPALFMQAVALTYKRSDGGEDPPEWRIDNPEKRSEIAAATCRLLDKISRIPGTDDADGTINVEALSKWLAEVRQLCARHGRGRIGDHAIGQLLSKAPLAQDGVWPCELVCEALEKIASADVADGFRIGVYNARGAHWRGEGGNQERELAVRYRYWAQKLGPEYPFVGSVLEGIAASYDYDARSEDSEARVRTRLRY